MTEKSALIDISNQMLEELCLANHAGASLTQLPPATLGAVNAFQFLNTELSSMLGTQSGAARAAPPYRRVIALSELTSYSCATPVIMASIFGVPMPVARSYPGVVGKKPLLLLCPVGVMSWKYP
jgi:hypothetical protein